MSFDPLAGVTRARARAAVPWCAVRGLSLLAAIAAAALVRPASAVSVATTNSTRPPPPAVGCMDARRMQRAFQLSPRALVVHLNDGVRYEVALREDCPSVVGADGALELLAPHGWACSDGPALVRGVDGRACGVATVAVLDSRGLAARQREAAMASTGGAAPETASGDGVAPSSTLPTVEVRGRRQRGFRGTTDYCVASRHVRSWHEDAQGLVVEVPPARAGGHRRYRIETTGSCPLLWRTEAIALRSGRGTGVVCGFPGDQVVLASPDSGERGPGIFFKPCPVIAVYPIVAD